MIHFERDIPGLKLNKEVTISHALDNPNFLNQPAL
jgi:hypothetical protein